MALGLCTASAGLYWVKLHLNLICTWNLEQISVLGLRVHPAAGESTSGFKGLGEAREGCGSAGARAGEGNSSVNPNCWRRTGGTGLGQSRVLHWHLWKCSSSPGILKTHLQSEALVLYLLGCQLGCAVMAKPRALCRGFPVPPVSVVLGAGCAVLLGWGQQSRMVAPAALARAFC